MPRKPPTRVTQGQARLPFTGNDFWASQLFMGVDPQNTMLRFAQEYLGTWDAPASCSRMDGILGGPALAPVEGAGAASAADDHAAHEATLANGSRVLFQGGRRAGYRNLQNEMYRNMLYSLGPRYINFEDPSSQLIGRTVRGNRHGVMFIAEDDPSPAPATQQPETRGTVTGRITARRPARNRLREAAARLRAQAAPGPSYEDVCAQRAYDAASARQAVDNYFMTPPFSLVRDRPWPMRWMSAEEIGSVYGPPDSVETVSIENDHLISSVDIAIKPPVEPED